MEDERNWVNDWRGHLELIKELMTTIESFMITHKVGQKESVELMLKCTDFMKLKSWYKDAKWTHKEYSLKEGKIVENAT